MVVRYQNELIGEVSLVPELQRSQMHGIQAG
jgi:hypothetical protein